MPPLLLDVGNVPDCTCTHHLEGLYKALSEGDDRSIWARHESPWLADHIEDMTGRFQRILRALQDAISRALTGEPIGALAKSMPPWLRWDEARFQEARMHLEGTPPSSYTLDDWMLLVDFLIQRYLPDDVIRTEAEYLSVKAAMLGKMQAALAAHNPDAATIHALAELVPTRFAEVPARVLSPVENALLIFAKERAGQHISDVTDGARSRMKRLIREHLQAMVLGQKEGTSGQLRQRIFDEFGQLNRDFRRIAVTEAGECVSQGFIAAQAPGQRVKRMEAYRGACDFCKSINGMVFTVVPASKADKDGWKEIWPGKTNVGRSAAPRKKVGGELVEREPHELWWPAAGVQHPHCRGTWTPVREKPPEVSQEFDDWLSAKIRESKAKQFAAAARTEE